MKTNRRIIGVVCLILVGSSIMQAQVKFKLDNSQISFFSEAPLENIEAHNTQTKGIIIAETGEFNIRVPIAGFEFEKKLMQQHFNENYLESDQYPNASFKGKIQGSYDLNTVGTYNITAQGTLEVHGVARQRKIAASLTVNDKGIELSSVFEIRVADHNIEIPSIVFNNIAEVVEVKISAKLVEL